MQLADAGTAPEQPEKKEDQVPESTPEPQPDARAPKSDVEQTKEKSDPSVPSEGQGNEPTVEQVIEKKPEDTRTEEEKLERLRMTTRMIRLL